MNALFAAKAKSFSASFSSSLIEHRCSIDCLFDTRTRHDVLKRASTAAKSSLTAVRRTMCGYTDGVSRAMAWSFACALAARSIRRFEPGDPAA